MPTRGAGGCEIRLNESGETFRCASGENVLKAMERLNRRGIPVGCRGGGCGICKVRVTQGSYVLLKQSRAHVSQAEEQDGYALACRVTPTSDLALDVVGGMRRAVLRPGTRHGPGACPDT